MPANAPVFPMFGNRRRRFNPNAAIPSVLFPGSSLTTKPPFFSLMTGTQRQQALRGNQPAPGQTVGVARKPAAEKKKKSNRKRTIRGREGQILGIETILS